MCVAGATGWTGRAVAEAIEAADDLTLRTAVPDRPRAPTSVPPGVAPPIGVPVHRRVADALDGVDVLVDFTSHDAVLGHVLTAIDRGVAVVDRHLRADAPTTTPASPTAAEPQAWASWPPATSR